MMHRGGCSARSLRRRSLATQGTRANPGARAARVLFFVMSAGAFSACGGTDGSVRSQTQPLGSGELALGTEWNAVVQLRGAQRPCPATLVRPNLVVTAAQCVAMVNPGRFACTARGQPVETGSGAGSVLGLLDASELSIHARPYDPEVIARGELIIAPDPALVGCSNDIAFVVLDRALRGIEPWSLQLEDQTREGDTVEAVGFGYRRILEDGNIRNRTAGTVLGVGAPDGTHGYPGTLRLKLGLCSFDDGRDQGGPVVALHERSVAAVLSQREVDVTDERDCVDALSVAIASYVPAFAELAKQAIEAAATALAQPTPGDGGPEGGQSDLGSTAADGCSVTARPGRPERDWRAVWLAIAMLCAAGRLAVRSMHRERC